MHLHLHRLQGLPLRTSTGTTQNSPHPERPRAGHSWPQILPQDEPAAPISAIKLRRASFR